MGLIIIWGQQESSMESTSSLHANENSSPERLTSCYVGNRNYFVCKGVGLARYVLSEEFLCCRSDRATICRSVESASVSWSV